MEVELLNCAMERVAGFLRKFVMGDQRCIRVLDAKGMAVNLGPKNVRLP